MERVPVILLLSQDIVMVANDTSNMMERVPAILRVANDTNKMMMRVPVILWVANDTNKMIMRVPVILLVAKDTNNTQGVFVILVVALDTVKVKVHTKYLQVGRKQKYFQVERVFVILFVANHMMERASVNLWVANDTNNLMMRVLVILLVANDTVKAKVANDTNNMMARVPVNLLP
eukprot:6473726-Amphidinium_carterae.4